MVGVAAAVVAHRAADLLGQGVDVAYQVLGRLVGVLGAVDRLVEVVDVGLMVLGVVDLHRLRVDVRLERDDGDRSEEHTSELQSLMRISYAVFCLKTKKK